MRHARRRRARLRCRLRFATMLPAIIVAAFFFSLMPRYAIRCRYVLRR